MRTQRFTLGRFLCTAGAAVLAAGLSGCGSSTSTEADDATEPAATAVDTAQDEPTASSTSESEEASPSSDDPSTESSSPTSSGGGDCLVGEWTIPEDQLQQFYDSIDTPAEFTMTGGTGLTFTDDTYTYTPDLTLAMTVAGQDAKATMSGSISGSYSTSDGVITTTTKDNSVDLSVTVGEQTIDGSNVGGSFLDTNPIASAPYECTGAGPVIMFDNGSAQGRTEVSLEPAG